MMNNIISFFFWSTRSKLRRSILVFFRIFLFRLKAVTNSMFFVITIITFYFCFIYTKTIIVKFFIFFISVKIANCCLNIIEYVNIVKKTFVHLFKIKNEAIFLFFIISIIVFCFFTKLEIDLIRFNNKI